MLRRVDQMFRLVLHLPPPSLVNATYAHAADWEKRDKPASPQMIRRVQHNALPDVYKEALQDESEDWKVMKEPKWLDKLQLIEQKEKAAAASKRTKGKDKRTDEQSDSDDSAPVKHTKKKRKEKRQPTRASGAGTARWCQLCKDKGYTPAPKFNSHHTNQCKDDNSTKLSGSVSRRDDATMKRLISKMEKNSMKKGENSGELKKSHKKHSSKKKKKSKHARRYLESSSSESESSDDSSDSSSDSDSSEDRKPRATR
jgi:hypothetical protein